ncbi:MAG: UvrB/UvrC motif-containing protein [Elusimicrobia bacterium]|nr:UvrB/UvrC motif-containing protein [Candidatus Liberimonas magnetica]
MLCNICRNNEANIHLDGIVNGKTMNLNLCEECAKKQGIEFSLEKPHFSIVDLLANLSDWEIPGHKVAKSIVCPNCGLSYVKFKEMGRLGCSKCYSSFEMQLSPLLKRIHGSIKHIGKQAKIKIPVSSDKVSRLRIELGKAIKDEEFEKAAELRDMIKKIKKSGAPPEGTEDSFE